MMRDSIASSSAHACAHCGLPSPPPNADEPTFCCVGCEAIYHAIHDGGFDAFYALRSLGQTSEAGAGRAPIASGVVDEGQYAGFDSVEFLDAHARAMDDGSMAMQLHLEGVHCAGCVWLVERLPHVVPGVVDANLALSRGRLDVRWDPARTSLSTIAAWLSRYGYVPHALHSDRIAGNTAAERALLMRVGASWAIAGNIMILAVAGYGGLDVMTDPTLATFARYVSLALGTLSLVYGGGVFFRRAAASLQGMIGHQDGFSWTRLSMDVPIALGIFVGWAHSALATFRGEGDVWFDSIAVLIAALLTARWLQMRGRRFAGEAAERLLSLLPATARRIGEDGQIVVVPADSLVPGDEVEVRAGDVVPADGLILVGQTTVHRAVVTGESRPEPAVAGDAIEAGVTNLGAVLRVRVQAAGDETRIGKLMRWVEDGERRRAPIVQLADRLGGIFVLVVLVAAAVTGAIWSVVDPTQAVAHVVALLVISCPCALGMATPLALTVGVGRAAKRGFFIKHDDVLQALAQATHVVFDKTGTLTEGKMAVAAVHGDRSAVLSAARLEAASAHPIARAIVQWGDMQRGYRTPVLAPAEDVVETPGAGLEGYVDGRHVRTGQWRWVHAHAAPDDDAHAAWHALEASIAAEGHSPVAIAVDGVVVAMLAMGDRLRDDAPTFLAALRERGITPALLSGDHPSLVASCAQRLGFDSAFVAGGVDPEGKRAFVQQLRKNVPDAVIVMVGDGVNDAIALQEADIGIAVHGGTQAALVAADIFVTREGVGPLLELLDGTHQVMRTVHRNLAGSALYNAVGITAAALGVVSPLVAAVAMPFSSLFVIGSSLLQRSFRAPEAENSRSARLAEEPATDALPASPATKGAL